MPKYKKYLYADSLEDIPRKTAYRYRKQRIAATQVPADVEHLERSVVCDGARGDVSPDMHPEGGEMEEIQPEIPTAVEISMKMESNGNTKDNQELLNDELSGNATQTDASYVAIDEEFWTCRQEAKDTVCPCATSTADDVLPMCLTLGLRHNLSWKAQVDILKMINAMYGQPRIPESKYKYLNSIDKSGESFTYHIYCSECEKYIGQKQDLPVNIECSCGYHFEVQNAPFFLSIDLIPQFKEMLQSKNVAESLLSYRFNREKINPDALEDIQDGAEYRKQVDNGGILSNPFNFSYNFSADGVPMGRSCGKTIWPLYVNIVDLPPNIRNSYVFIAGLYVGDKDPNQNVFLEPFVEQSNRLSTEGFSWNYNGEEVVSKVIPMCAVVDSVARFQMLNMSGINSFYACTMCYQKAEHTIKGQRFPPSTNAVQKRTDQSTRADMQQAFDQRDRANKKERIVKGVKGPTPLLIMQFLSMISAFSVEYMHCILLGVIRTHMELIFDSRRKKFWIDVPENLGIEHLVSAIDARLCSISSLSAITRSPRSISQRAIWKASEWRSWLVFYCIPCLEGLLRPKYLSHLVMLSQATTMLLQKSVTVLDVNEAHRRLLNYVFLCDKYFGVTAMVLNVHLLTHVAQCVMNWGPLWTHNAFVFEGQNRYLLQLLLSPKHVAQQIARKYLIFSNLPSLINRLVSSPSVLEFCENTIKKKLKHFVQCEGVYLLGKEQKCFLSAEEYDFLSEYISTPREDWTCFQRMLFNGSRYSTDDFARGKKHNDSFVVTHFNVMAVIKSILNVSTRQVYILAQEVITDTEPIVQNLDFQYSHVNKIVRYGENVCFKPCDIKSQCVFMCYNGASFTAEMPYGCLGD